MQCAVYRRALLLKRREPVVSKSGDQSCRHYPRPTLVELAADTPRPPLYDAPLYRIREH